jgi:ketosteroid isomerase-like protein
VSQENVEIVRRIMEAFERRDTKSTFAAFDPAVVWDAIFETEAEALEAAGLQE